MTMPLYRVQFRKEKTTEQFDPLTWQHAHAEGMYEAVEKVLRRMGADALPWLELGEFFAYVAKSGDAVGRINEPLQVHILHMRVPQEAIDAANTIDGQQAEGT
jgi:hypothetical protein